jgi:hypothetical protein
MQTFETGGAVGDLLRAYGSAAAPANAAVLEGMGMPYRGPMTAPRQEGVSSGENFRAMGDPRQQAVGQMIGDPANLAQPVGARLANALKFAKPDAMKMVQELSQGARSQMVERQAGRTFAAPQDAALRLAQERAALPVEQGGLGLPPNNTSEQRAAAMGFDTPSYHGSGEELRVIDNEKVKRNAYGKGLHSASDPQLANIFATHSVEGQNLTPLKLRLGNQATKQDYKDAMHQVWEEGQHDANKIRQILIDKGFDTVTYNHGDFYYPQGDKLVASVKNQDLSYASLIPENVRSRFAAFDPFRRNAAIAAAMGVAAPDLLAKEKKK